jgi:hypothetical protein
MPSTSSSAAAILIERLGDQPLNRYMYQVLDCAIVDGRMKRGKELRQGT